MRILVVEDDNFPWQKPWQRPWTDQLYVVDLAEDGEQGWDCVKAFDYDLMLLDVMLPGNRRDCPVSTTAIARLPNASVDDYSTRHH